MEREYQAAYGFTAHTPDQTSYHDPAELHLTLGSASGVSVAAILPPRNGLKGVVVPRSNILGGSRGKTKIHQPGVVNIDPHVPGEDPIRLDLANLDESSVEAAFNSADGEDFRQVAFSTFAKLAHRDNLPPVLPNQAIHNPEASQGVPYATLIGRAPSGLEVQTKKASFVQQEAKPTVLPEQSQPMPPTESAAPSAKMRMMILRKEESMPESKNDVQQPQCKVTFEIEGFGTFETAYHKVIQGEDGISLVLVYDSRCVGLKYFPPALDTQMFVDVHDLPSVFSVRSAGLKFKVDELEMCILLIEKAVLKEE